MVSDSACVAISIVVCFTNMQLQGGLVQVGGFAVGVAGVAFVVYDFKKGESKASRYWNMIDDHPSTFLLPIVFHLSNKEGYFEHCILVNRSIYEKSISNSPKCCSFNHVFSMSSF